MSFPSLNLPEEAPLPAAISLNVPEEAPATEPIPSDASKIAALERKVALLTEAVVMLLEMKSEAEKIALTQVAKERARFPLPPGGVVNTFGPTVEWYVKCNYMTPTSDERVFEAAATELEINTLKTDSLLTELHK
jgi:hypothetical protein